MCLSNISFQICEFFVTIIFVVPGFTFISINSLVLAQYLLGSEFSFKEKMLSLIFKPSLIFFHVITLAPNNSSDDLICFHYLNSTLISTWFCI